MITKSGYSKQIETFFLHRQHDRDEKKEEEEKKKKKKKNNNNPEVIAESDDRKMREKEIEKGKSR